MSRDSKKVSSKTCDGDTWKTNEAEEAGTAIECLVRGCGVWEALVHRSADDINEKQASLAEATREPEAVGLLYTAAVYYLRKTRIERFDCTIACKTLVVRRIRTSAAGVMRRSPVNRKIESG